MKKCAWCGADGRCQHENLANYRKNRLPCKYPLKNCKAYITESELRKQLNEQAHDRPLTRDTRYLVKLYHSQGMSSLVIAFVLGRSVTAIEKILENK